MAVRKTGAVPSYDKHFAFSGTAINSKHKLLRWWLTNSPFWWACLFLQKGVLFVWTIIVLSSYLYSTTTPFPHSFSVGRLFLLHSTQAWLKQNFQVIRWQDLTAIDQWINTYVKIRTIQCVVAFASLLRIYHLNNLEHTFHLICFSLKLKRRWYTTEILVKMRLACRGQCFDISGENVQIIYSGLY